MGSSRSKSQKSNKKKSKKVSKAEVSKKAKKNKVASSEKTSAEDERKVVGASDTTTGLGTPPWIERWMDRAGFPLPNVFGDNVPEWWSAGRDFSGIMPIEEIVDDSGITIRGELPGIDPENDVSITVENGRLNITAVRRQREESDEEGAHRTEFKYGTYKRSLLLPGSADPGSIDATYTDGILEIHVPIAAGGIEAERIPVRTSS